jgi:hypothetical protein
MGETVKKKDLHLKNGTKQIPLRFTYLKATQLFLYAPQCSFFM